MFQGYIAGLVAWCDFIYHKEKMCQILNFYCFRVQYNGTVMFWSHIFQIAFDQDNVQLKLLPKLQRNYVF